MKLPLVKTAMTPPPAPQQPAAQASLLQQLQQANPALYQALMTAALVILANRMTSAAPSAPPREEPQPHWPLM